MAKITDSLVWEGDKFNKKQGTMAIPAGPAGDDPGLFFLESRNTAGTLGGLYVWASSINEIRISATKPTAELTDGSALGTAASSGANNLLSNLGVTTINTSLISDTDVTDDLGSASYYWRYLYASKVFLSSTSTLTGGSSTAALVGDLTLAEGKITIDTTTDETTYVKKNVSAGTAPAVEIEITHADDQAVALLIDSDATGAYDAMQITHAGTGSGLKITTGAATGTALTLVAPASETTALALLDGTTGSWLGATNVGMLHLKADGTLAHANASLLYIAHSGTTAASAVGSSLRINDSATAGSAASIAAYVYSASQHVLKVQTNTVSKTALQIACAASTTAAMAIVAATDWIGASTVGALEITGTGVLEAGANLVRISSNAANTAASYLCEITSTGNFTNSTNGLCLRVTEAGTAAGTSYAAYILSTANNGLRVSTGAVGVTSLLVDGLQAQTASIAKIDAGTGTGWVGATGVGALHISGDGTLAHANASMLLIAHSGAMAASGLGGSLRITDTSSAVGGSYVAAITSTNNNLLYLLGVAVAKTQLTIQAPASQTAAMLILDGTTGSWLGANGVGMLQLQNDGGFAHVNASCLLITNSGIPADDSRGHCLRIVDTGNAAAGTMAYAAFMSSNDATVGTLYLSAAATKPALTVAQGTSSFAEVATMTGGVVNLVAVTDVTAVAPTGAEIAGGSLGAANTHAAGFMAVLDDNNAHAALFIILDDGASYHWIAATKCL